MTDNKKKDDIVLSAVTNESTKSLIPTSFGGIKALTAAQIIAALFTGDALGAPCACGPCGGPCACGTPCY